MMIRLRRLARDLVGGGQRGDARDMLHSAERMQAILDRERMRADRGNSSFALLTFTLARRADRADLGTLAQTLHDRIRATDDAGLLGPRRVGVVLPETPAAGAWKLAEDICQLLPLSMRRPECHVYVDPSKDDHRDPDADARFDEPVGQGETRPMQVLFMQPLPWWKRAIDILGATTALVLAAPVMLVTAGLIKLTSPGPVFFAQHRDALGGRRFTIYKFRTMSVDAEQQKAALRVHSEQDGPAFKMTHDPRVTRLGRILRTTSIDELPQLFNVLLGDMSLVGPRPLPCDESRRCEAWQRRRLDVTPGLTCIWQVRGRSRVSFCDWIRMDIQYIRSRSLVNDMKLIAQTVPAVVARRGAR